MDQKLRTERRKLADLKAAEYNPRKALTPDDAEYQKIRRSIEEFVEIFLRQDFFHLCLIIF